MRRRPGRVSSVRSASSLASSASFSTQAQWATSSQEEEAQQRHNQSSCSVHHPPLHSPVYSLKKKCTDPSSLQICLTENISRKCAPQCGNLVDSEIEDLCRKGMLDAAFGCLDKLPAPPCHDTLVFLIKACTRLGSLSHAKHIHAFLLQHQIPVQGSLGEHLISTLAKFGSLHDARVLLDRLSCRTSLSWSSLISGLVEHGHPEDALDMYAQMLKDGASATNHTLVKLLKACGNIPDPEQGRKLHAVARSRGITSAVFVGNVLISMYKKFGSVAEAEEVFGEISQRDHVSWNSMLSAYLCRGEGEKMLLLYRQMRMESCNPNPQTCLLTLQACSMLIEKDETSPFSWKQDRHKYLSIIHALHADAKRFGFDTHAFVGTTLVTAYGKCGAIREAEHVSSSMPDKDLVSWTAMFSAYGHQGQGTKALQLYKKMLEEGGNPDSKAFAIALQACEALAQEDPSTKVVALEIVHALHIDAWNKGLASDVVLGSLLVVLYNKCGTIKDVEDVFCELRHRECTVWTAMVSAYVDEGEAEKAILLYRQMLAEGVRPDNRSFVTALHACAILAQEESRQLGSRSIKERSFHISRGLHVDAQRRGLASDSYVSNMLIGAYGKCGAISEAEDVFTTVSQRDEMAWLKMLTAYLELGRGETALLFFKHMQERGTHPNPQTLLVAIQACGLLALDEETMVIDGTLTKMRSLEFGQALLADARKEGYDSDIFLATAFVNLLGKYGSIEDAENVFAAFSKPNVVLWTAMLSAYTEQGQGEKALDLYKQMQRDGLLTLDYVIIVCVLQACGKTGNLEVARHLHFVVCFSGPSVSGFLASVLAYAYGSCARIGDLQAIFDVLVEPDLITMNSCIAGHAGEGNLLACEQMALEMQLVGCKLDGITFASLLSACSQVGLVYRGLEFAESLSRDHQLALDPKHYSTLLDLLGRAGDFNRIENLTQTSGFQADSTSWLCLLGACRIHGNIAMARHAFDAAVRMRPNESAPYILMSGMYVKAGRQDLAEEVDKLRSQVFKDGMAWPELD
ncbi:hypothetical protein GOP47_0024397 [Adiantum capillus-veneris]|uniref:Pentatricopeptide repeat-containing protein n=1 Tax=Adiantum capillus-veneris TaxID=13818 RepID=A0A9D4Z4C6_ADICA|nr:hypothetical protein GOP47_0024397 [Adiantum capillus-veneris]